MGELEDSTVHPGTPDGFERLWTPHRMVYIQGENKPASADKQECPFCAVQLREDREGLIVHRSDLAFAVLNLYPYSPGHLLICPYRHVADLTELDHDELCALGELTQDAMRVVRAASAPHGFNLGSTRARLWGRNRRHLHQHVVPRWAGDANFLRSSGRRRPCRSTVNLGDRTAPLGSSAASGAS